MTNPERWDDAQQNNTSSAGPRLRPIWPKILRISPEQPRKGGRRSEGVDNPIGIFKLFKVLCRAAFRIY
jgi:hypothetical protein